MASNLKYSDEDIMNRVEDIIFFDSEGISGEDDIYELFSSTDMGDIMAYVNGSAVEPLNISQLFAEYDQPEDNYDYSYISGQNSIEEKVQ